MSILTIATAEIFVKLLIGVTALKGTDGLTLKTTGTAIGVLKNGQALHRAVRDMGKHDAARQLARGARRTADAWAESPDHRDVARDAAIHFEQALAHCVPEPADFVGQSLDPDAIVGLMLGRLRAPSCPLHRYYATPSYSADFFRTVARPVVATLASDADFVARLTPRLWSDLFDRLGRVEGKLDRGFSKAADERAEMKTMLAELLERSGEAQSARESGITDAQIMALAEEVADDVDDPRRAFAELERAIEDAKAFRAQAALGSNLDSVVGTLLVRLQSLRDEGRLRDAQSEADAALARFEADEAERAERANATRIALLDTAIAQDLAVRDAEAAADRIARKTALEQGPEGNLHAALRMVQDERYARGRDKGLNLDLEVAIHLARRSLDVADNADRRGRSLNDLGNALTVLGEREAATERLDEAVDAYRAALEDLTRDRVPLDWATTQMNLGTALAALAARDPGPSLLELAVSAYRAAEEIITERGEDALRSNLYTNLGGALRALGRLKKDPERLFEAIQSCEMALPLQAAEPDRRGWATTKNNLGSVFGTLWELDGNDDWFSKALSEYREAIIVRNPQDLPVDCGETHFNIGFLHFSYFEKSGETAHLKTAERHVREALKLFREAEASHHIAQAEDLLAEIWRRRNGSC